MSEIPAIVIDALNSELLKYFLGTSETRPAARPAACSPTRFEGGCVSVYEMCDGVLCCVEKVGTVRERG